MNTFRLNMPVSDKANALLSKNAFALLVGMVLDQQVPIERAFAAPLELQERLGFKLTPKAIASMDEDELVDIFCIKPALHRFPAANARRVYQLAHLIVDEYRSSAARIWTTANTGTELLTRVHALPGFGERKARIFVALIGKQLGVQPDGWQAACEPFGDEGTTMSVADIFDEDSLQQVRAWKQSLKQAAKET